MLVQTCKPGVKLLEDQNQPWWESLHQRNRQPLCSCPCQGVDYQDTTVWKAVDEKGRYMGWEFHTVGLCELKQIISPFGICFLLCGVG